MKGLIAKKVGMTQVFDESGNLTPVTVIHVDPNTVIATKTQDKFGYDAVLLGVGEMKKGVLAKDEKHHRIANQFPEGVTPKSKLKEFRDFGSEVKVGDTLGVELFNDVDFVDVIGTSKGKGFQGVVKRHHFGGVGQQTHGQHNRGRKPGSIGACSYPAKVFKGMRMAGQMGGNRVTVQNLQILKVIAEHNLLLVKGSVPGCKNSIVLIEK